jgi:HEAT repeat protein
MRPLCLLALCTSAVLAQDPPAAPAEADAKAKAEAVKAAIKGKDVEAKKKAVADAAGCAHALVAAAVAPALMDPDAGVREAAAGALGGMKGLPEAARALNGAVGAHLKNSDTLVAVFRAIAGVNHASSVPVLKDYVGKRVPLKDEKESKQVVAAIESLGALKAKSAVEVLLDLYSKQVGVGMNCDKGEHAPVYSAIRGALEKISGQSFGMPDNAKQWWRKTEPTLKDDLSKK